MTYVRRQIAYSMKYNYLTANPLFRKTRMLKRKNKDTKKDPTDVGFIKRHTIGSSNEISFSVLDAKSDSMRDGGTSKPMTHISSPDTVTKPRWTMSAEEVSARKIKRKRNKFGIVVLSILLALIVLAVTAFFGIRALQHQMDYSGQLSEQVTQVKSCAHDLENFEQIVNDATSLPLENIDASTQKQMISAANEQIQRISKNLTESKNAIGRLQEHLINPVDTDKANKALSAINAEQHLIEIGKKIIEWAQKYPPEYADAQAFMDNLLAADSLAREAAALASESTRDSISSSLEKSNESLERFNQAAALIAGLRDATQSEESRAIFQQFIDYVALRVSAQQAAINADNAYLNVNSATLIAENEKYAELENEAAQLIGGLTEDYPTEVVKREYEEKRSSNPDIDSWKSEYALAQDYLNAL